MWNRAVMVGIAAVAAVVGGCGDTQDVTPVSFAKREPVAPPARVDDAHALRVAVGSMLTPRAGFVYSQELLDYIEAQLGRPVRFVDRASYTEINDLIEKGDIDIAFVCPGPYVEGHDAFGMKLLVAPQARGATVYYSYIIVNKRSAIASFDQLRGARFAFADPASNSGALVPRYMLAQRGETPETFFREYTYTYAHDKSIQAVAQGVVDGAAVDSLIWEYIDRTDPSLTSKTRILARSPPFGIPPVVARPGLDPDLERRVTDILLSAHETRRGRAILDGMMIDRFVRIDDAAYDSIRRMRRELAAMAAVP